MAWAGKATARPAIFPHKLLMPQSICLSGRSACDLHLRAVQFQESHRVDRVWRRGIPRPDRGVYRLRVYDSRWRRSGVSLPDRKHLYSDGNHQTVCQLWRRGSVFKSTLAHELFRVVQREYYVLGAAMESTLPIKPNVAVPFLSGAAFLVDRGDSGIREYRCGLENDK